MTILTFVRDSLRTSVEAATGGKVTVLYDDKGNPSYMRIVPRFNIQDVDPTMGTGVHPAFVVNGVTKNEIFAGQYIAVVRDGRALSLPGVAPQVSINFNNARAACVSKGAGWHMMTNWEWAAIMLRSLKDGFEPRGNTNHGRHHVAQHEVGVRVDGGVIGNSSGNGNTFTGSGPASWRHDNTAAGISDLVGNVWEWIEGFKLIDGRIYMPADNNYALPEASWPATDVYFDATGIAPSGAPRLNSSRITTSTDTATLSSWAAMTRASGYTPPAIMAQACIDPVGIAKAALGYIAVRNHGERVPFRGGSRFNASNAGFGALTLFAARSFTDAGIGFRPVFIQP